MTMHAAITGLDAEILAVQSELAAHIDGILVPLMVRRALARLALGQDGPGAAASPAAVDTPAPERLWRSANLRPGGTPGRILDLIRSAPGGSMASLEINAALSDLKQDTVLKAKRRLVRDGFLAKRYGRYALAPRGDAASDGAVTGDAGHSPSGAAPAGSRQATVLRILEAAPRRGWPTRTSTRPPHVSG